MLATDRPESPPIPALTHDVARSILRLPPPQFRAVLALIACSCNPEGDGLPWVVTRSVRDVARRVGIAHSTLADEVRALLNAGLATRTKGRHGPVITVSKNVLLEATT